MPKFIEYCRCGATWQASGSRAFVEAIRVHFWQDHQLGPEHGPATAAEARRARDRADREAARE
jgi:hypothetical protein